MKRKSNTYRKPATPAVLWPSLNHKVALDLFIVNGWQLTGGSFAPPLLGRGSACTLLHSSLCANLRPHTFLEERRSSLFSFLKHKSTEGKGYLIVSEWRKTRSISGLCLCKSYFIPLIALHLTKFGGKNPRSKFVPLSLFCTSKRGAAKFLLHHSVKSSRTGKLCSWCSVPCCFGYAVLLTLHLHWWLFLHCQKHPVPWHSQNYCGTSSGVGPPHTAGPLPVTNRDFPWYIFPPKSSLCGAFRCSNFEHYHSDSLLWKQDLTVLLTSASVLLIHEDKVASFMPTGSPSHQTYPCLDLRWAVPQIL